MALDSFGLTLKQRLFCEHYISSDGDGIGSVYKAGYEASTSDTAKSIASENLSKPYIKKYIQNKMTNVFERIGFGAEERAKLLVQTINACKDGKTTKDGIYDAEGVYKGLDHAAKIDGSYAQSTQVHAHLVEEGAKGEVKGLIKEFEVKEY